MTTIKPSIITISEKLFNLKEHSLRQKSSSVSFSQVNRDILNEISTNLIYACNIGNGIASSAPQIGVNMRIFYVSELTGPLENTIIINPEIVDRSTSISDGSESCLSIPGRRGNVPRHDAIKLKYIDLNENEHIVDLVNFQARVIQHEIDHLDGILYIDKVSAPLEEIDDLFWLSAQFKFRKMKA